MSIIELCLGIFGLVCGVSVYSSANVLKKLMPGMIQEAIERSGPASKEVKKLKGYLVRAKRQYIIAIVLSIGIIGLLVIRFMLTKS